MKFAMLLCAVTLFASLATFWWVTFILVNLDPMVGGVQKNISGVPHKQQEISETLDDDEALYHAISTVTNLWAEPASSQPSAHRVEIEAAVVANLDNPFINQVVVVLDNVTDTSNCSHFEEHMISLYKERTTMFEYAHAGTPREMATLTCIDDPHGQPTYFQMFNYSQHPAVKGRVAVMHNADHAFDESLKYARDIRNDTVITLASWGYAGDRKPIPTPLNHHFCLTIPEIHRPPDNCTYHGVMTTKRNNLRPSFEENRCRETRKGPPSSWDSYVFDKRLLKGKMTSEAERIFMRDGWKYPMNSYGSENVALHDFLEVLGNYSARDHKRELNKMDKGRRPVRAFQGCQYIASYHFHFAAKMHSTFGGKTMRDMDEEKKNRGDDVRKYRGAPFIRASSDAFENETRSVTETL